MNSASEAPNPQEFLRRILQGGSPLFEAKVSPDGNYVVVIAPNEMRMSHWINSAAIWEIASSKVVVVLGGELWSTDYVAWKPDHALEVGMRRYPGDVPRLTAAVDLDGERVQITSSAENATVSFQELNTWLERYYRQQSRNP